MAKFTCVVGELRADRKLPDDQLLRLTSAVSAHFATVGIELAFDLDNRDAYQLDPAKRTTSQYLHRAVRKLTGNSAPASSIDRIGLVLADVYEGGSGVLGVMFDRGFNVAGETPVGVLEREVPREGCAVFLETIEKERSAGGNEEVEREIEFTMTHELGHVFNLWHTGTPRSFMTPSCPGKVYSDSAFVFRDDQRKFLAEVGDDRVRPGGNHFEDRAGLGPLVDEPHQCGSPGSLNSVRRVRLEIGMARSAYWHFEPIELQLTLRRIGRGPAVVVPDKLDPGYEDFAIWIRDPGGAVRRYRAPQRYCSNVASRRIAFGRPFYRDVMLFGQAGGYTFRETGAYAVWCEYRCNGVLLASNRLRFVVRRPEPASSSYRELARICGDPAFAEELFHRRDSRNSCDPSLLALLDEREDGDPVVAGLRYAIGRAGVSAWHRQQLIRAQRSGALDGFQRRVVRRALARIEPPGD